MAQQRFPRVLLLVVLAAANRTDGSGAIFTIRLPARMPGEPRTPSDGSRARTD